MIDLSSFEESHILFEEDGRIRQPMIQLFRAKDYLFEDPGINYQFYLHREWVEGAAKYHLVRTYEKLFKGFYPIVYFPIKQVEVIHPFPGYVGQVPWDVVFLRVYTEPRPESPRMALLRVMPKSPRSEYRLRTREGVVCRFMDEDNQGLNKPSWLRERVEG